MATKLSDVLEQESSGIMFPFRTNVKPVKTEQQVYTPTDGIMNVTGTQYEGPDATITYGSEEQGFPRQLKEIEKGLLPRFDQSQFPDAGKGKVETTTTPTTQPIEPDKPIMDPCPPGFKLIDGVCQPIQQQPQQDRGGGGKTFTGPKISASGVIDGYTAVLGRDRPTAGRYDVISKEYGKAVADKVQDWAKGASIDQINKVLAMIKSGAKLKPEGPQSASIEEDRASDSRTIMANTHVERVGLQMEDLKAGELANFRRNRTCIRVVGIASVTIGRTVQHTGKTHRSCHSQTAPTAPEIPANQSPQGCPR